MAISDRIQAMYTHTSDIYDSVELTGVDTTDIDKNLVNVPNTLKEGYIDIINNGTDTLYNNFPKVSGEGTSLTLNNTYQAPMRNNLKGNTSQTGTPTPTSPIPVNVVSGDNEILIQNANLWSSEWEQGDITNTGADSSTNNRIRTKDYIPVIPNQHYAIKRTIHTSYIQVRGYDENKNFVGAGADCVVLISGNTSANPMNTGDNCVIYPKEGISYLRFVDNSNDLSTKYMMIKGDTIPTDYVPYEIDTYNIDLPIENLLDTSTNTRQGYINSSGTFVSNVFNIISDYIPVDFGETYTLSYKEQIGVMAVSEFDSNKTFITRQQASNKQQNSFTLSNNTKYVIVGFSNSSSIQATPEVWVSYEPQFEKGSKVNSYTPYGTTPIEMCKIGNYQDQFKKATGKNLAPINLESETYNSLQITNNNNGTFTLYGNPTGSFGRDIATNLTLKAGTYTISANAMPSGLYIALDNTSETQLSNGTLSKTFTLASDTTYTSLGIWFTKNKDYDVTIQLQIEEGSSVTEWQPMNGWYLHKEIGKWVFNGTDMIEVSGLKSIYARNMPPDKIYTSNNGAYFERAKFILSTATKVENSFYENPSNFLVIGSSTDTLETLKTKFDGGLLYYILATPTSEGIPTNLINQLEEFYQAQSKNNQTNISQINNDLGFIISASALKKGV